MCLGVPMRVVKIEKDGYGKTELDGVIFQVDLSLVDDVHEGDFVIVHAGFAIEKLDVNEAELRIKMFQEIAAQNTNSGSL